VSPSDDRSIPMYYAPGRDLRLQERARSSDGQARWLGVPWQGRQPGSPISASSLQTTTLAMLRAAFGLTSDSPRPAEDPPDMLDSLVDRAWAGGLLANPRPLGEEWSVAEVHQRVEQAQPVVTLLDAHLLPGHPPTEALASGDQPIVVIGATPGGLVVSDPSFSSSLGYGLEVDDATFLNAWQAASTPLRALALSTRPAPPLHDDHARDAGPTPQVIARPLPTASPVPAVPTPTAQPAAPISYAVAPPPIDEEAMRPLGGVTYGSDNADPSWIVLLGAVLLVAGVFGFRRVRARRVT
jgi:hypothetical protein